MIHMILVAGEALIDMLPTDLDAGSFLKPVVGGSPFNVAIALGRSGVPVRFLCPISTDAFGRLMAGALIASGVDIGWCRRTPALSTLGFITTDRATNQNHYAFYTSGTAGCALEITDVPDPLPEEVTALHVGSFSLAVEPCGTAIEQLVRERAGSRLVSLDPNIRPFLISDRASYLARLERIAARADLIKASVEDLEWLHPGTSFESIAAAHLRKGTALFVVTRGPQGAVAFSRTGRVEVSSPAVDVVDTVGAGDTLHAALLTWLTEHAALNRDALEALSREALSECLTFATAAAAVTCTRPGCDPPWRRELP